MGEVFLKNQCENKIQMVDALMKERQDRIEMKAHYEKKIAELDTEKKKLLKEASTNGHHSKDSIQRQKAEQRLKVLSEKLKLYKSRIAECERAKKTAATNLRKILKLRNEIEANKRQRVLLAEQIKEKTQTHRKWAKENER